MTDVIIAPRAGGDKYCFEIYFNGNGSPWILAAFTVVYIPILITPSCNIYSSVVVIISIKYEYFVNLCMHHLFQLYDYVGSFPLANNALYPSSIAFIYLPSLYHRTRELRLCTCDC